MVGAILAGRKTQTRRIVRGPAQVDEDDSGKPWPFVPGYVNDGDNEGEPIACPYGSPGDKLWVREKWTSGWRTSEKWTRWGTIYASDLSFREHASAHEKGPHFNHSDETFTDIVRWHPSIFMPRHASRITLEIVGVRVERLQSISVIDAIAEGIDPRPVAGGAMSYTHGFRWLWDEINGDRATWASNPWVWVVEFRRVQP